jgi:hypothetical protein
MGALRLNLSHGGRVRPGRHTSIVHSTAADLPKWVRQVATGLHDLRCSLHVRDQAEPHQVRSLGQ